ncbi:MAG TPA: LysM peptidoglycan-binding domain-containing protein [Archangium sp.]|nr:LysM peptidoglycan-binding domain-containing protein [Archangium sp.]
MLMQLHWGKGAQMNSVNHMVRAGDTLGSIAKRYHTTVENLAHANNIQDPNRLRVGQVLRIQSGSRLSSTSQPPPFSRKATSPTTQPGKAPLVKTLKFVGPPQKNASKTVVCCGWAAFQAELYEPPATPEDRKKIRWSITDGKTKAPLHNAGEANAGLLLIDPIPDDWEHKTLEVQAYCQAPSSNIKVSLTVKTCGEVGTFIKLVRKVETAYPSCSGEQILNSLRKLAGYDSNNFRKMYGGLAPAAELKPIGALTQGDLDSLKKMTQHTVKGALELGIAKDSFGKSVALGHVLTGISAGQHRNKSIDLTPSWSLGAGEQMDNLHATTLAGDLGQMAVYVSHRGAKSYIGPGTDATDAELVGDIDGFLLGSNIGLYTSGKSLFKTDGTGAKLSELLHAYYCVPERAGAPPNTAADRFTRFSLQSRATLVDQTQRFTTNYAYVSEGKWSGLWSDADGEHAKKAVDAFWDWLEKQKKEEAHQPLPGMSSGSHER